MRGAAGQRHGGQRVFFMLVPRALGLSPVCTQLAVWPRASLVLSLRLSFLICRMKALDQWVSTADIWQRLETFLLVTVDR